METRENVESGAAAWIARRERSDWTEADQDELDAWIAAATDNRVAWLRLSTAWQQTSRLKALGTDAPRGAVPTAKQLRMPFFGSRAGATGRRLISATGHSRTSNTLGSRRVRAVAASILLMGAGAAVWYSVARGPSYETDVGALQAVALVDGSRVTLNTDTHIKVDLTPTERRVNLSQGEAYFEVAKDPARPFVVKVGDKLIIAVGTQFSVRRDSDGVRVLVAEGKVRLEQGTDSGTAHLLTQLGAGNIAHAAADGVLTEEKPIAEVEQLLSWRSGYLTFDRTTLAAAVAEFNRYSKRKIVIQDSSIAGIRVGGNFRVTNVNVFVRLIQSDLPIAVAEQPDRIVLTGVPPPAK